MSETSIDLENLAKLIRYYIIVSTTSAKSGHVTSSLSSTELMAVFFAKFYRFDLENPKNINNDRLIFSKGHASPLFYALYAIAGKIDEEELLTLRQINSRLEGHPSFEFKYTESASGSLGQGLGVGLGMALNAKRENLDYKTYVLLGDSEFAEGSIYEALQIASYYKLNNLIAILDVNRLGQRGQTMLGWDADTYQKRVEAFGWKTIIIDGHNIVEIEKTFEEAQKSDAPFMIIAKTVKGKGVALIEDQDGWHGKALDDAQAKQAIKELGEIDKNLKLKVQSPKLIIQDTRNKIQTNTKFEISNSDLVGYENGTAVSTRKAYGEGLAGIGEKYQNIVALDAEVGNSTFADIFTQKFPERYFEMFIAEQNMVSVAQGLSKRGKKPFVSTFAAFFSRAHDQIRMGQYSKSDIVFAGSHAGVSIGADGASQMGLEDIAMFRSILDSVVIYPADANCTAKMVELLAERVGISYIRTTRADTPVIYVKDEQFKIGGSKVVKKSDSDQITIIGAGISLHEALKAYEELKKENISARIIDLYSIKPIDSETLKQATSETKKILVVEDHFAEGGIAEAVRSALKGVSSEIESLSVTVMPHSGSPEEVMELVGIDSKSIITKVKEMVKSNE